MNLPLLFKAHGHDNEALIRVLEQHFDSLGSDVGFAFRQVSSELADEECTAECANCDEEATNFFCDTCTPLSLKDECTPDKNKLILAAMAYADDPENWSQVVGVLEKGMD